MLNLYTLPTTIDAAGQTIPIRNKADYRTIIDVNIALTDPELSQQERMIAALTIFAGIPIDQIRDIQAAAAAMCTFIAASTYDESKRKHGPQLVNWEQDAPLIISGVNSVLGREVRADPYMHWWTFVAAYMAIGESALSTVVAIRSKMHKGKKLEKYEEDFKRDNPEYFVRLSRDLASGKAALEELWEDD